MNTFFSALTLLTIVATFGFSNSDALGDLKPEDFSKYQYETVMIEKVEDDDDDESQLDYQEYLRSASVFDNLCLDEYHAKEKWDETHDNALWEKYQDTMHKRIEKGHELKIYYCPRGLIKNIDDKSQLFRMMCLEEFRAKNVCDTLTRQDKGHAAAWKHYRDVMDSRIEVGRKLELFYCPQDLVGGIVSTDHEPIVPPSDLTDELTYNASPVVGKKKKPSFLRKCVHKISGGCM